MCVCVCVCVCVCYTLLHCIIACGSLINNSISRTCVGYELLDSGRGAKSSIISAYPISVSGITALLNTKNLTLFMLRF